MQGLFKKKYIDCLFSPVFFSTPKGLGAALQQIKCFNIPGSCALYAFACVIKVEINSNIKIIKLKILIIELYSPWAQNKII